MEKEWGGSKRRRLCSFAHSYSRGWKKESMHLTRPPRFPAKIYCAAPLLPPAGGPFPPQKRKPNGRPSPGGVVRGPRQGCEYYVLPYSYCFFSRLRQDINRTNAGLLSSPLSVGRGTFRGRRIIEPPRTGRPPRIERGGANTTIWSGSTTHDPFSCYRSRARTCFAVTKMTFKGETRV